MYAYEDEADLPRLLKLGYGAPPTRGRFVEDLLVRMKEELGASQGPSQGASPAGASQGASPAGPSQGAGPAPADSPGRSPWRWLAAAAAVVVVTLCGAVIVSQNDTDLAGPRGPGKATPAAIAQVPAEKMVPLEIKLPKPMFEGTPKNIKQHDNMEKYVEKPRPPFLVPEGTANLALARPVKSSDPDPIIGELNLVTDGDNEGADGSYVELGPGLQWVQIDLGRPANIYAVVLWHYHAEGRVYHDVVIQVSDDPDFVNDVKTIYNNDFDNSSGLGIGKDLEYIDDYRGRLVDARGVRARCVRLYSNGNTSNDMNHYIEAMVFGKPAAPAAAPAAPAAPAT